ncbi:MAG: hypothetical protein RIC16_17375 [Rhodospirillales bacterium]
MLWQHNSGWSYEHYPIEEDPGRFAPFESLVLLWRSKWSANRLPGWSSFELLDLSEWWGALAVFDAVEGDPYAFDVRLWGTLLVELGGFDLTGQRLAPGPETNDEDTKQITRADVEAWRRSIDDRTICMAQGPVHVELRNIGLLRYVVLPLGDDGLNANQVLYAELSEFPDD